MPLSNSNITARIEAVKAVLSDEDHRKLVEELENVNDDLDAAVPGLKLKLTEDAFQKVELARKLAEWSEDHLSLVKAIADTPGMANLRDVALNFNAEKLVIHADPPALPK